MRKHTRLKGGPISIALLMLGASCGSSDQSQAGAEQTDGFGCSITVAGIQYCYVYSNLSTQQEQSATSACEAQGGTIVSDCPMDGRVGCCALSAGEIPMQQCFYTGTPSGDEMACTTAGGVWSEDGPATGAGGDGAGGRGLTGDAGPDTKGGAGSGSAASLSCSMALDDSPFCFTYSNVTSEQNQAAQSECASQGGRIVNACPTANVVGCCALEADGVALSACYYFGTPSEDQASCAATGGRWSAGSQSVGGAGQSGAEGGGGTLNPSGGGGAGVPSGTGGRSGTGGSSVITGGIGGSASGGGGLAGTSTTTTQPSCGAIIAANALATPDGYISSSIIGDGGYAYAYSDENLSSICIEPTAFCGKGITGTGDPQGVTWGAAIAFNLNQAPGTDTPANPYPVPPTSSGVSYAVSNMPAQGLRIVTDDGGIEYCAVVATTAGKVPWSAFNTKCWDDSGSYLAGPPVTSAKLAFDVPAVAIGPMTFNFCVTAVSYY